MSASVLATHRRLIAGGEDDSTAVDGAPYQRSVASVSGSV